MEAYRLVFVSVATLFGLLRWVILFLLLIITAFFIRKRTYTDSRSWAIWAFITIIAAPYLILEIIRITPPDNGYIPVPETNEVPTNDEDSNKKHDGQQSYGDDGPQNPSESKNRGKTPSSSGSGDTPSPEPTPEPSPTPEPPEEYDITTGETKTIDPNQYTPGSTIIVTAAEKPGFTFLKWSSNQSLLNNSTSNPVTFTMPDEEVEITPIYEASKYIIRFLNYDGSELQNSKIEHGQTPVYNGETPTKPADNTYTYSFAGWEPEITPATGAKDYTAKFNQNFINYTITFEDDDGSEISKKTDYHYGDTVTIPADPTKPATVEYTYTFAGWDNEVTTVSGDATYTATYTATKNKYTVTFENYDGTVLQSSEVEYGQSPSYTGETPVKSSDNTYYYTFDGWTPEIIEVTGEKTYTAKFVPHFIDYVITFNDDDGAEISKKTDYHYGDTVTVPADPTKEATAEYTYTFVGWDNEITTVSGNATYTATYTATKNKYTIVFENYDGTVLQSSEVEYGQTPAYNGETPAKPATAEHTYTFSGWDPEITAVTGSKTYTATFVDVTNRYTVSWKNEDGTVLEIDENVPFGETPTYDGDTPTKSSTAEWTYTFSGWEPEITSVSSDTTYTATYSQTKNKYTIRFVNYDGTELQNSEVEYGQTPSYSGETPTKPADNTYTYSFSGWSPEIATVTEAKTYTTTYDSNYINYTVTFNDDDGTEISKKTDYHYGDIVTVPADPTKEATAEYTYSFAGWTPEIANVTADATYTATYTATKNKYAITFKNYDGSTLQSSDVEYGQTPVYGGETPTKPATAQYTYNFSGWEPEIASVTGEAAYTAKFSETVNKYTITWKNDDDTILETDENIPYGESPTYDGTFPTKDSTAEWTYAFYGWTPDVSSVTGDAIYTAAYLQSRNKYTISFTNYDGTELQSSEIEYGQLPAYNGETPTKPADHTYNYTFDGWDKEIVSVTKAETYTATFSEEYIDYTVIFLNDDGSEIMKKTDYHYGDTVTVPADPTKETTAEYTYTFAGWDSEVTSVSGNATYTATYTATKNKYTITFENYDGTELQSSEVEYGQTPVYTGETPTKPADNTYTYSFNGWSPEITSVTEAKTYTATFEPTYINYHVIFKSDDDETIISEKSDYHYGDTIIIPEDPVKEGHTFIGWFTGDDIELTEGATVTHNVTYYAHFNTGLVCKLATKLHVEPCNSASTGGCLTNGYRANDPITYGELIGDEEITSLHGIAYDCDVNNNGEIDVVVDGNGDPVLDGDGDTISAERFYFLDHTDDGYASLIYYSLLPKEGSSSMYYADATALLPTTSNSDWTNPHLREIDGKVSRFADKSELDASCTSSSTAANCKSYLLGKGRFLLENSAFSTSTQPDGIWLISDNPPTKASRIHTRSVNTTINSRTEQNAPKPVIEVPYSMIEKRNLPKKTVTFESNGGTAINDHEVEIGDMIGTLPTPEREGYMFFGWYETPELYGEVTAETIIEDDVTFYARWVENSSSFPIVFHEINACTFNKTSMYSADPITGEHCRFADGVNTFIDTGVMLFSDIEHGGEDNYNKDFELGFDIVSYIPKDQDEGDDNPQATFVNSKQEKADAFPGFVVRRQSNSIQLTSKFHGTTKTTETNPLASTVSRVRIKRENGAISYSYNDDTFTELVPKSLLDIAEHFDTTVWFGAAPLDENNTPMQRPLKGTLTDMYIKLAN